MHENISRFCHLSQVCTNIPCLNQSSMKLICQSNTNLHYGCHQDSNGNNNELVQNNKGMFVLLLREDSAIALIYIRVFPTMQFDMGLYTCTVIYTVVLSCVSDSCSGCFNSRLFAALARLDCHYSTPTVACRQSLAINSVWKDIFCKIKDIYLEASVKEKVLLL